MNTMIYWKSWELKFSSNYIYNIRGLQNTRLQQQQNQIEKLTSNIDFKKHKLFTSLKLL